MPANRAIAAGASDGKGRAPSLETGNIVAASRTGQQSTGIHSFQHNGRPSGCNSTQNEAHKGDDNQHLRIPTGFMIEDVNVRFLRGNIVQGR